MNTRLALACLVFAACGPSMPDPEVPPPVPLFTGGGGGAAPTGGGTQMGIGGAGGSGGGTSTTPPDFATACTISSSTCGPGTSCVAAQAGAETGICTTPCSSCDGKCIHGGCFPYCGGDADCKSGVACVNLGTSSHCAQAKASVTSSVVIDPAGISQSAIDNIDLKRDYNGGLHVVYRRQRLPRYGHCTSDCANPASWNFVSLERADSTYDVQMGVSSSGKVYLSWVEYAGAASNLIFAQCTTGDCTVAANWSTVLLATSFAARLEAVRNLVVDSVGRVHLLAAPGGGDTSYLRCTGNCAQATSWTANQISGLRCERASLAVVSGRVGIGCVYQGSAKLFECIGPTCWDPSASSWTTTTFSNNALAYSTVSLSYDADRPRIAFYDGTAAPNVWGCNAGCSTATNWTGIAFAAPTSALSVAGLHLALNSAGEAFLTNSADSRVLVRRCTVGLACWTPGSAWLPLATVETNAQVASTLISAVPVCPGTQTGFARVWDRETPVLVSTSGGAFVLTQTHDFWGCDPNVSSYVQNQYRIHLSFAPVP